MNTPPDLSAHLPDWAACLSLMTRNQLIELIVRFPIRPSNATLLAALTDEQTLRLISMTRGDQVAEQVRAVVADHKPAA